MKTVVVAAAMLCIAASMLHTLFVRGAQEAVDQGKKLADSGRMEEAQAQWREAVRQDPNCAEAWEFMGRTAQSAGDFATAVDAYRHLARLKPQLPVLYRNMGYCVTRLGDADNQKAFAQANKDLEANPNDLPSLSILATLLAYRDEQVRLLDCLRRRVRLQPENIDFHVALAQALVDGNLFDEARPVIEQLKALAPNNPAGYDLDGRRLLFGDGSPHAIALALDAFKRALELGSKSPVVHLNLGRIYIAMKLPDQALAELHTAVDAMPFQPDVFFELERAFRLKKRPDKAAAARAIFLQLRQNDDRESGLYKRCYLNPNHFEDHIAVAELLLNKGQPDKAGYYLYRALTLRPQDSRAQAAEKRYDTMMRALQGDR